MSAPPSRPSSGGGGRGWKIFAGLLIVLLLASLLGNLVWAGSLFSVALPRPSRVGPVLVETLVEDHRARAKIAVLDVEGMIAGGYIDAGGVTLIDLLIAQLKRAEEDAAVKAVVLRVNSPGGEVLTSDEIANAVREFQDRCDKPVIASMGGVAASGGYYISAPCRWIVANELTLTGSIGVIMQAYNYRGLMDRVGVRPEVYKSGRFKDMLRGSRAESEVPPEERKMLQDLIDETYGRFRKVVEEGRTKSLVANGNSSRKLVPDWTEYADGRVLSGRQAFELGFVDELGNFKAAFERAKKLARVDAANLVEYRMPFDPFSFLRIFGKTEVHSVKVDLGLELPKLKMGHLYFLFLPMSQ
ncbi:MAG: signal peptide peptidase SppA [Limisphaerales bacterium]